LIVAVPDQLPSESPVAIPTCMMGNSDPPGPAAIHPLQVKQ
jgi:hypothetical protein